jgi:DNA polymerase-3 subunit gamma/tau
MAKESGGSMRDALSLLDQMISCANGPIHHEQVLDLLGAVDTRTLFQISEAALAQNIPELLGILDDAYSRGRDLKKLYSDLIGHFRNLLVIKISKNPSKLVDLSAQEIEMARTQIQAVSHTMLTQTLDLLMREEQTMRFSAQPRLALEMAFIRLGILKPALPIEQLIEGLEQLRQDLFKLPGQNAVIPQPSFERKPAVSPSMMADTVREGAVLYPQKEERSIPAPQPLETGDTPESLDRAWQNILNRISRDYPALAASLSASVAVALSDKKLAIEVTGSEFNLNMVQRDRNRGILKEVCSEYFSRPLQIDIATRVLENRENQGKREAEVQLKNEALHHPLVQGVIEVFEGKVLDVNLL